MSFVNKNNKVFLINKRRLFYTNIQILWITYVEIPAILTNVSRPRDVDVALLWGPFNIYIYILWTVNTNICNATYRKQNQNWAVLKLPVLIDKLQELESDQTIDLRSSLRGQGSFELAAQSTKLFVSHETWTHLTTDQRERRLNQLLIFKQRNNDDVTSSDG
jgi:hypothetical protein